MGQFIPLAITLAGTALKANEDNRVLKKQEETALQQTIARGTKQAQADARADQEVQALEKSTSNDERVQRLDSYMQALQRASKSATAGLDGLGGEAYQKDAAQAAANVLAGGQNLAGLQARIDAPALQRQNEAFGYGRLGTDLDAIKRQVAGDEFVNQLRLRAIRRRPEVDLLSGIATGVGGAMAGGGSGSGIGGVVKEKIPLVY